MTLIGKLKYRKSIRVGDVRPSRVQVHSGRAHGQDRPSAEAVSEYRLSADLDENLAGMKSILGMDMDLLIRQFRIQINHGTHRCALVYLDNASSKSDINKILASLMFDLDKSEQSGPTLFEMVISQCIPYADVSDITSMKQAATWVISGNSVLFMDGVVKGIGLCTQAFKERAIEPPGTEQVIQGAREAFIESLGTNVSLIRRRMRSPDLRVRQMQIGQRTTTNIAYLYHANIANQELINEVERRLRLVETDALYGSGYLEQFIEDNHYSPFPQVQNTERPDKAVAAMLEGRVVILVDGSPFALIVPAVFSQFYQTAEDYDTRFHMASMIRGIRLLALIFSLIFPSLYVSLISYNPEMIPTKFAVAVAGGRAGVPFPAIAEIFGLELVMEILREATIRLPQQIGGALSIVGVLVIGEAAVQAGFVSPITVVIVAMTTIGSFATPAYNAAVALRMLRFPVMILAGMFGLYGVMVGIIFIINHLNSLESFGVPYLSPVVPADASGLQDTVIRAPVWSMRKRPKQLATDDTVRVNVGLQDLAEQKQSPLDPRNSQMQNGQQPNSAGTSAGGGSGSQGAGSGGSGSRWSGRRGSSSQGSGSQGSGSQGSSSQGSSKGSGSQGSSS
jgi:spore germination protein KA